MQRLSDRCPRCDQPLGMSWDMWGRYYLCGACGFTAEDDDDLYREAREPAPSPTVNLAQIDARHLWQSATRK
ncbi:MAG: hypothetical protein V3S20_10545 [Dehalococcoidia bacterium]